MGSIIYFADALGADAEGLVRLVACGATAPVCAKALEEGVFLVEVAGGVEGRDGASLVLKMLEVRDEADGGSGSGKRN